MDSVAPSRDASAGCLRVAAGCPCCEDLRAEVDYLRGELALDDDGPALVALRMAFGITAQQARVLRMLHLRAGRVVAKSLMDARVPSRGEGRSTFKPFDVAVHSLRRQLGHEAIITFGDGYALTPHAAALIDTKLAREAAKC